MGPTCTMYSTIISNSAGIRVAKYGKQLYENYRGIVEEMAHDDLDQLASSRFSADAITLATAHAAHKNWVCGCSLSLTAVLFTIVLLESVADKKVF